MNFLCIKGYGRFHRKDRGRPPDKSPHPRLLGKKGGTRTRVLFVIILGILIVHIGSQLVSAYVDYMEILDTVRQVVRDIGFLRRHGVEEGKERILAKAQELQLPLSDRQVIVKLEEKTILVQVWWEEPIGVWDFTYPYPFEIEETRHLR